MKKGKKIILLVLSFLFLHYSFISTTIFYAETNCDNEIKSAVCEDTERGDVYNNYPKYKEVLEHHKTSDAFASGFHRVGWWIIQGLATISNVLSNVTNFYVETVKTFIESDFVMSLQKNMNTLAFAMLPIMFLVLSFFAMSGKQAKFKEGLLQTLIAILFMNGIGYIYQTGFDLIPAMDTFFKASDETGESNESFADTLLLASIIDIEYLKEQIDDEKNTSGRKNNLTKKELDYLDVNASAPYEKSRWFGIQKEFYFNRMIVGWDTENDVPLLMKFDNQGLWGIGKTYIYKYKINYWEILLSLFFLIVGQLYIEWKRVEILLELGKGKVFSHFIAILSIHNKRQLWNFLKKIFELFTGVMLTTFSILYYVKFSAYISTVDINFFAKLPLVYANIVFLFKMSEFVNLIFGINTKTNTGFLGKYLGAKALTGGAKYLGNKVQSGLKEHREKRHVQQNEQEQNMMRQSGASAGNKLADERQAFLDEKGTTINDYQDVPHYQSDYKYNPTTAEELAKSMRGSDTKKGYRKNLAVAEKHLDTFNQAGREAYEQKFPTYAQRQKEYATHARNLEEKDNFERLYPAKYNRKIKRDEFTDEERAIARLDWEKVLSEEE